MPSIFRLNTAMSPVFSTRLPQAFADAVLHADQHLVGVRCRHCGAAPMRPSALAAGADRRGHHLARSGARLRARRSDRAACRASPAPRPPALPRIRPACRPRRRCGRRAPGRRARGAAAHHLSDDRFERRPVEPQPDLFEGVGLDVVGRERAQVEERVSRWPFSVSTSRRTGLRCSADCSTRQRSSCQVPIVSPSTARTVSPRARPAAAATEASGRRAEHRTRLRQPYMKSPAYAAMAKRKLAAGPATTMAKRRQTLWRLNARCASPLVDRAFALIEHLHVAAERNRGDDPLGPIGAAPPGPERRPKPTEKRSTLTSNQCATM